MSSVPEVVLNNPFRVLGVYANSSQREIVASISKTTKFMEVGRKVDFPLDLPRVKNLPVKGKLSHSLEDLNNASAVLSNSEERLKYAQFWFLRMTPLDDEAFEHLFDGKLNYALSVWCRENNLSSLQNSMIINLWKCNFKSALQDAENLYTLFSNDFLKAVDSKGTLVKSSNDLIQSFIDALIVYITPHKLLDSISSPFWIDYLVPTISDDTLSKINAAIQDAKDQLDVLNSEGARAVNAINKNGIGETLLKNTKDDYSLLQRVVPSDNPRLQLIGDRLANMFYECSIDEYNNRKYGPEYAIKLLQHALSLSNNSIDKEEINSKIALFQKKAEKIKEDNPSSGEDETGCFNTILFWIIIILLVICYVITKK